MKFSDCRGFKYYANVKKNYLCNFNDAHFVWL